jgi:hypothetical protein
MDLLATLWQLFFFHKVHWTPLISEDVRSFGLVLTKQQVHNA